MRGDENVKRHCCVLLLGFTLYLCAASSIPFSIDMAQRVDDALFINLGRAIANGHWLGHYNQATLVKGPVYPVFLALASLTGLPFNIVQFVVYFLCCWYFARVLATVCGRTAWFETGAFVVLLLSPRLYMVDRVLRDVLYASLTILLFAMIIDLLFIQRTGRRTLLLGVGTGVVGAAYWLTREEGLWIVPSLAVLIAGALLKIEAPTIKERAAHLVRPLSAVVAGAAVVVLTIGGLNWSHYGRFVTVEMTDSTFQRAMADLQRVGSTFEEPYLPVPRAARALIYKQSPLFAELRDYLEPLPGASTFSCPQWKNTCGDISGAGFVWDLRSAVDRAGVAHSASQAARFYHGIAKDIEAACRAGRLPCAGWQPPLIPPVTREQWQMFPATLGRAVLLAATPSVRTSRPTSYLATDDSADALAFLNHPFATPDSPTLKMIDWPPAETMHRNWVRSVWLQILDLAAHIDQVVLIAGFASFVLTLVLAWRGFTGPTGIVVVALFMAMAARLIIITLVEISSFPAVQPDHVLPADALALAASLLSIHMMLSAVRPFFGRSDDSPDAGFSQS